MKKYNFFLFFIFVFTLLLTPNISYAADDFLAARVKDISDHSYEKAMIELLDNAQNSIVISCSRKMINVPWTYTALRRQVIKSLKKVQDHYSLIKVKFFYGRDAAVKLTNIPGKPFPVSSNSIMPGLD